MAKSAKTLNDRAAALLADTGWPEAGATLEDILRHRTMTWATAPRPMPRARANRYRRALDLALRSAALEDTAEARLLAAGASFWLNDPPSARRFLDEADALGAGERSRSWRVVLALAGADENGALKAAEEGVALRSTAWGLCLRAEANLVSGHKDRALRDADESLRLAPGHAWALVIKSEAHRELQRFDDALATLDELVRLHPSAWSHAVRGRTRFNFRDQQAGLADLERALALDKRFTEGYAFRAEAYRRLGRLRESLRDFNRALRDRPGLSRMRSWRGATLLALGRPREAILDFTSNIDAEEDANLSWALCNRAHAYLALGEHAQAVSDMNRAVRVNPKNGWIFGASGREGGTLDRANEVIARFDDAVRRRPRWAWGWAWRGETKVRAGRFQEGLEDLRRAVRLAPREGWILAWRGLAREGVSDLKGARADYERAITLAPEYPAVLGWLARRHMKEGRYASAKAALDRMLALDRFSAWGHCWRGECRLRGGDPAGALADLETAVNLDPAYEGARALLAAAREGKAPRG